MPDYLSIGLTVLALVVGLAALVATMFWVHKKRKDFLAQREQKSANTRRIHNLLLGNNLGSRIYKGPDKMKVALVSKIDHSPVMIDLNTIDV